MGRGREAAEVRGRLQGTPMARCSVNLAVMWNLDNYRRTIGLRRRQHVCGKFRCGFSRCVGWVNTAFLRPVKWGVSDRCVPRSGEAAQCVEQVCDGVEWECVVWWLWRTFSLDTVTIVFRASPTNSIQGAASSWWWEARAERSQLLTIGVMKLSDKIDGSCEGLYGGDILGSGEVWN